MKQKTKYRKSFEKAFKDNTLTLSSEQKGNPKGDDGESTLKPFPLQPSAELGLSDSPSDIEDELKLGYFKTGYGQGIQKATDDILLLIDDCRKGLLTNQQADILHVKICKLSQIQKK